MKIDIHTHILPEHLPKWADKFGYGGFVHLDHHCPGCARMMVGDKFFREIEHNCWDGKVRIQEYAQYDTQVQVISTIPVLFAYWAKAQDGLEVARYLNDHIAGVCREHPKHFIGLGTVPLQDPQLAIQELERCMGELGLAGVEIGSHVNQWNLSAPELFPFFEAAERLGAAIFIHPWDMMGQERMPDYWLPWLVGMPAESTLAICSLIFGGVLERLPKLRIAIAHGGGSFAGTFGRIAHGFECRPDLVAKDNAIHPREYLGKFWVDSLVHDVTALDLILRTFGEDKVALGTDYPFPLGESIPGKLIKEANYNKIIQDKLCYKNALNWLDLDGKDFF